MLVIQFDFIQDQRAIDSLYKTNKQKHYEINEMHYYFIFGDILKLILTILYYFNVDKVYE